MKRIHNITIKRMVDNSPDTSWLGEYANSPDSKFSIDRAHDLDRPQQTNSREHRYFNPSGKYKGESPEDTMKYVRQDYERMERLNAGDWCFIGIRAEAEVTLADHVIQTISSGGLWGVESDSDSTYFESVEQEELSELSNQLYAAGFSKRAIVAAFNNIERKD